ncbi:cobalt ABC transporter, ATPase subunit [Desulforamulus reducens MI-1]|uniref:ABC transporter ATP-binding protein n=1 Tax=Desulforamulus reducens (strain ATCC BAA-1160 / DSM 100696 / MI-1) TaxID=349161 RepID=A4J835_DESRM|nr:ATP-binding cassette domain-containing protein [Desulforamulus reducens]ABO51238.1 cobalt ABC transporter, ATPase subunit [Desulforamulus reducens MI-1]
MSDIILETHNLHCQYPDGTVALQGISIAIKKDKKIALLGTNGAGKSTLLLHLIALLKPTCGNILFKGKELQYNRSSLATLRSQVGLVFQDPDSQLFAPSVRQEVSFGPINLGLSEKQVAERVFRSLELSGIPHLADKPVHFLSYGQKKLVSIASVLAMNPELLILDEPTASLDPQNAMEIMNLLNTLNQKGMTVLLVTHNVEEAYGWADEIILMNNGLITGQGTPENILSQDELLAGNHLTKPLILDIFNSLQLAGHLPENLPVPRTREALMALIQNNTPVKRII